MDLHKCSTCGTRLLRVIIKREGRWYCPTCKGVK